MKRLVLLIAVILSVTLSYHLYETKFLNNHQRTTILYPTQRPKTHIPKSFEYERCYYNIDLINGGKIYGIRLKNEGILITLINDRGLTISLAKTDIKKISRIDIKQHIKD